jgi:hypothetical protein
MREPRWRKQVEKREREPGAREEKARMRTRDRMHALLAASSVGSSALSPLLLVPMFMDVDIAHLTRSS